jgi:hypothetical protein
VTKDESFIAVSRPIGSKATTVGKWLFAASNDGVKINRIRITNDAGVSFVNNVSNMKLFVDGTQKGNTAVSPSSSYFDIDLSSDSLMLEMGVSKQIEIRADIDTNTVPTYEFKINAADFVAFSKTTGEALESSAKVGSVKASLFTVANQGTLEMSQPVSDQVVSGNKLVDTDIELVRVKFNANNEPINLNQIQLTAYNNSVGTTMSAVNVKVYELNGTTPLASLASLAIGDNGYPTTTAIPMANLEIASGGSKVLVVKGQLNSDTFNSNDVATFGVYATGSGVNATQGKGALSQKDCFVATGTVWAQPLTAVYAKAEIVVTDDSPKGDMTTSATMPLMKFTVKAVGGDIYISTSSAIKIATGGTATFSTTTTPSAILFKVNSDGTETKVAEAMYKTVGGAFATNGSYMYINDVNASDDITASTDYAISEGSTVTFVLRANNNSLTATTGQTFSASLQDLVINDAVTGAASVATIYDANGQTNPVISGNAMKF